MNDANGKPIVHVTVLDGKTIKTTWREDRASAKRAEELFRHEGADRTKVFHGPGPFGGLGAKYRIVGWWK